MVGTNASLRRFVRRWRVPFGVVTVVLYAVALVLVVFLFPDVSNLWISIFVLFGGLTASMSALGALLAEDDED